MSFDIFPSSIAKFFNADDALATGNLLCNAYCISFCGCNESFDILPSSTMTFLRYPFGVLAPVPTAVPPSAILCSCFCDAMIWSRAIERDVTYAANSLPSVTGSASIK